MMGRESRPLPVTHTRSHPPYGLGSTVYWCSLSHPLQDAPNLSSLHPCSLLNFRSWFYHIPIPPHLSPSFVIHHPQVLTYSSFFLSLSRGVGFVFGALHRGCLFLCLSALTSHGHLRRGADLTPWLSKACVALASGGGCVEEHMTDGDVYVVPCLAAVLQRWWSKALCILKLKLWSQWLRHPTARQKFTFFFCISVKHFLFKKCWMFYLFDSSKKYVAWQKEAPMFYR